MKKRRYIIAFIGEGESSGYVFLTDEEAEIARYVLGVDRNKKWEEKYDDAYSPLIVFDPVEEDEDYEK